MSEQPKEKFVVKEMHLFLVDTLDRPHRVLLDHVSSRSIMDYIVSRNLDTESVSDAIMFLMYLIKAFQLTNSLPESVREELERSMYHQGVTNDARLS
jgi:hypothetical protein